MLTGGKTVGQKGYYIEPTIFTNVKVKFSGKYTEILITSSRLNSYPPIIVNLTTCTGGHVNSKG